MAIDLKVSRIPVRIRPEFFVGAVLLGLGRLNEPLLLAWWVLAVGVFVTVHELGHAFAFRYLGHSPAIEVHAFGGHTRGDPGRTLSPKQDIFVSFAGPALGFLVGGIFWAIESYTAAGGYSPLVDQVFRDILWINIGWGVINMLPMLPLDGGRIMAAVSALIFGPGRGRHYAHAASFVVAGAVGLVSWFVLNQPFLAIFAVMFGLGNYRAFREASSSPFTTRYNV